MMEDDFIGGPSVRLHSGENERHDGEIVRCFTHEAADGVAAIDEEGGLPLVGKGPAEATGRGI
jgi:hypothetical protein